MINKILSLSQSLISLPSTKDNPLMLKRVIEVAKKELEDFTVEYFEKNNTPSVLIYPQLKRPKKFKIILNAHLDVIPSSKAKLQPKVLNNKLYGLGALDMKGAAAVEILVFKELAKKLNYPLGLQLVTDEEIGGFNGTKYQIEKGVRADFVIAGEPTKLDIENKAKGIIWAEIEFFGKSAHSAYPWKGENVFLVMNDFINNLKKTLNSQDENSYQTTFNIASVTTNNIAFNKIPDYCKLGLDIRYIPEDRSIVDKIKKLLPNKAKIKIILNEPAFYTSKNNQYLVKLKKIAEQKLKRKINILGGFGSSDIRHYAVVGVEGVEFGPSGEGMAEDSEWVDIKSLEDYYLILKKFLLDLNHM